MNLLSSLDVLIIEDDPITQALLEHTFKKRGHSVVACSNAEDALTHLQQKFYPILFLDLQLPGMSGFDFCRQVRSQKDGDQFYILVGTGSHRLEDLRDILKVGASDYVMKPYQPELLNVRLSIAEKQVREIAARKQLEHELKFLATRDPLTKLLNRSQLEPILEAALQIVREGQPAVILYIDLDNFKVINDTLGHQAGDHLLSSITQFIRGATRPEDELVRFGGDEFVLVLPNTILEIAVAIANRLRKKIEEFRFVDRGMIFQIGASIGIAPVASHLTPRELLVIADAACYAAKARGRNRVEVYTENSHTVAEAVADIDWASRIKEAMGDGSLDLWFQTIFSTRDSTILYQEGLLRYRDPVQKVIVSCASFLNAVRRYGQGVLLDRFVMDRAVQFLVQDPEKKIGVNLSTLSFKDANFIPYLEEVITKYSFEPSRLYFEITETDLISNIAVASQILQKMRKMGFPIALDDFGTGFSSLACLKNLPIDFLKIDCAFIHDLPQNEFNRAILQAIHEIALLKNIKTIAEGVETEEQFKIICSMGIDYAQGFLLGEVKECATALRT